MRYGSVCSGIEAATMAWKPLGWEAAFYSEIEKFPRAVLEAWHPNTPLHGDFTTIRGNEYGSIDLLVGGTPCQSFSNAGRRAGLDDPRGDLALEFLALARRKRPRWLVWENVPGILSVNDGRDFGIVLGALRECGYRGGYRVLDAKYHRVAQRRRRVFFVGYLGDRGPAAAVLFERSSLRWDSAPRKIEGEKAPSIPSRSTAGGGLGTDFDCDGGLIAKSLMASSSPRHDPELETYIASATLFDPNQVTSRENRSNPKPGTPAPTLAAQEEPPAVVMTIGLGSHPIYSVDQAQPITNRQGDPGVVAFSSKDYGADAGPIAPTMRAMGHADSHPNAGGQLAVAIGARARGDDGRGYARSHQISEVAGALDTVKPDMVWQMGYAVRRFTPRECERLQGFPDDYTLIDYGTKRKRGRKWRRTLKYLMDSGYTEEEAERVAHCPDGPRYKALGNSMAVPVMAWIGRRIAEVDRIMGEA